AVPNPAGDNPNAPPQMQIRHVPPGVQPVQPGNQPNQQNAEQAERIRQLRENIMRRRAQQAATQEGAR
ncbi:MAG TPA: hypothetical protein VIM98_05165, partial [Dyella sp.]|uniref:hypothetical protein n=1 Tax=Dyella sp. TaxID=1869338 RepID=UPI002F95A7A2